MLKRLLHTLARLSIPASRRKTRGKLRIVISGKVSGGPQNLLNQNVLQTKMMTSHETQDTEKGPEYS